jgi:hypothetical protein
MALPNDEISGEKIADDAVTRDDRSGIASEIAGEATSHAAGCLLEGCAEGCAEGCGSCSCSAVVLIALLASAGSAIAAIVLRS